MSLVSRVLPTMVMGALVGVSFPLHAQDQISNADLLRLVKQQAAEIKMLKQRLTNVEAHERQTDAQVAQAIARPAGNAATPPAVASTPAAQTPAQVQAAINNVRDNDIAVAQAQAAANTAQGGSNNVTWGQNNDAGPRFSSDDGFFTFKPDGRLLLDFTGTNGSSYPARNINGADLESARLGGEGTIGPLGYHVEVEFAGDKVSLRETYLTYRTTIFGFDSKLYVGNFLKDLGTEGSAELARVPFMDRSAASVVGEPLNDSFGLGSQLFLFGNNWHYSLSVSGNAPEAASTTNTPGTKGDSIAYLTRAHWNPLKGDEGFIHVGAWYYYENISRGVTSLNDAPPIALDFNQNLLVSGSTIDNPTQDHGRGYELGGVYRSFWLMSEYAERTIDSATSDPVTRHGSALSAGWLITGEKPGFSSRDGSWHGTNVIHPVTSGGWGGWEIAARVDHYNYMGAPRGGDGIAYTAGVNWYLNDWSRLMFNYIRWYTDNKVGDFPGPDWGNSVGIRTQIVF